MTAHSVAPIYPVLLQCQRCGVRWEVPAVPWNDGYGAAFLSPKLTARQRCPVCEVKRLGQELERFQVIDPDTGEDVTAARVLERISQLVAERKDAEDPPEPPIETCDHCGARSWTGRKADGKDCFSCGRTLDAALADQAIPCRVTEAGEQALEQAAALPPGALPTGGACISCGRHGTHVWLDLGGTCQHCCKGCGKDLEQGGPSPYCRACRGEPVAPQPPGLPRCDKPGHTGLTCSSCAEADLQEHSDLLERQTKEIVRLRREVRPLPPQDPAELRVQLELLNVHHDEVKRQTHHDALMKDWQARRLELLGRARARLQALLEQPAQPAEVKP